MWVWELEDGWRGGRTRLDVCKWSACVLSLCVCASASLSRVFPCASLLVDGYIVALSLVALSLVSLSTLVCTCPPLHPLLSPLLSDVPYAAVGGVFGGAAADPREVHLLRDGHRADQGGNPRVVGERRVAERGRSAGALGGGRAAVGEGDRVDRGDEGEKDEEFHWRW